MKNKETFTITDKNQIRNLLWVASAVSNDPARISINRILVDSDYIVGTNGKALHRLNRSLVPMLDGFEGTLNIVSKSSKAIVLESTTDGIGFPAYKSVIPPDCADWKVIEPIISPSLRCADTIVSIISIKSQTALSSSLLLAALGSGTLCPKKHAWGFAVSAKPLGEGDSYGLNPIVVHDKERLALVMPVRLD